MYFILHTLIRRRKIIVLTGLGAALVMAVVSLLLPKWYTATTSIFPPEPSSDFPSYADLVEGLALPILGPSAVGVRPGTIYIDILRSRRVGERIIEEFGYKKTYGQPITDLAINALHSHSSFQLMDNGLLIVRFEDKDKERAAAVTNRYAELLDEFNREFNISQASKTRSFVERQIELHSSDLSAAEEALRTFKERHQALELEEQIRATIDVVADLTAQAIALEVELEYLSQFTSTRTAEYRSTKERYDGIREQLKRFKTGGDDTAETSDDDVRSFFPVFEEVPQVSLELARLIRQVRVEEKVFELLVQEYEKARIDEARDTPTIQVLDPATVPEVRTRPKRKLLVILGGVLGMAWSSLTILFVAAWRRDSVRNGEMNALFAPIVDDFGRVIRRRH